MGRSIPLTTEHAFLLSGLIIILFGWLGDFLGALEVAGESGHEAGPIQLRLFVAMFGVAFATIGVVYENFDRLIRDPVFARRHIVAFLFLLDGSFHLYAFNDHLAEAFPAAFFAVVATLQLIAVFVIPRASHRLHPAWLGLTGFLLAAYVATRTFPVWPLLEVELVEPLGVLSKSVEILTILFLVTLVRTERAKTRAARAAPERR